MAWSYALMEDPATIRPCGPSALSLLV